MTEHHEYCLTATEQAIVNCYQKGLPLTSRPYQTMADKLGCSEEDVINALDNLKNHHILSRVGPVFDHQRAGASTLAALSVPDDQLVKVAGIVNQFEQVNHNYEREHTFNLWFVITAHDLVELERTIALIEVNTGFSVLVLPMEASYHIDLGFSIDFTSANERLTR